MKRFKIVLLFLFVLCVFSICIFFMRNSHISRKRNDALRDTKDFLEYFETSKEQEKVVKEDGAIGIIKIPRFDVVAPVFEGTSSDVLKFYVRSF